MAQNVAWQVFDQSGQPIPGKGAFREDFESDSSLVMAASHVWIWRRRPDGKKELLLQKRAADKKTWPGYIDVSATGHVDLRESFIECAVREAKEEIGLEIDPERLHYIFSLRTPLDKSEIDWVYLYELTHDEEFSFHDGEVESCEWVELDTFREMRKNPEEHKLVPQGDAYFSLLFRNLPDPPGLDLGIGGGSPDSQTTLRDA